MTHGHELVGRAGGGAGMLERMGVLGGGEQREKIETIVTV